MLAEAGKVLSVTCGFTVPHKTFLRDFCKLASGTEFHQPIPPAFVQCWMVKFFRRHYFLISPSTLWGGQARFSHPHLTREETEVWGVERVTRGHHWLVIGL